MVVVDAVVVGDGVIVDAVVVGDGIVFDAVVAGDGFVVDDIIVGGDAAVDDEFVEKLSVNTFEDVLISEKNDYFEKNLEKLFNKSLFKKSEIFCLSL